MDFEEKQLLTSIDQWLALICKVLVFTFFVGLGLLIAVLSYWLKRG